MNILYAQTQQPQPPQPQQPPQSSLFASLFLFIIIFIIFYFLLIRPQTKEQKKHQEMLSKLKKGDKIVTTGGLHGVIVGINEKEDIVIVKIAENVKVEISRNCIARVKGEEKIE
jgi:preprotein translocase subunit YajC